jgi:2-polyprenyl-3-methyl-5-hydroxy-6-metoxy-1,4-benzoquinol methylase
MKDNLQLFWDNYYKDIKDDTVIKDKQFFHMELITLAHKFSEEIQNIAGREKINILELGAGTGLLAETLLAPLPESSKELIYYTGIDFSSEAIKKANERNLFQANFIVSDFFEYLNNKIGLFDLIVSQRSMMAILEFNKQKEFFKLIKMSLTKKGVGILSEGTRQGLNVLNKLRKHLGVNPIENIWHCLYVDEEELYEIFSNVEIEEFCSLYWLITRVIYPYFKEPKHNTSIHDFAASLPQGEGFSLVKLIKVRP